jgi:hypothetical protein
MNDVAKLLINTYDKLCIPEQVNNQSITALIWTCRNEMDDVAELIIRTFGILSKP